MGPPVPFPPQEAAPQAQYEPAMASPAEHGQANAHQQPFQTQGSTYSGAPGATAVQAGC